MTFLSLRNRLGGQTPDLDPVPTLYQIPAETERRRDTPYQRQADVQVLYRAASAAGGATAMQGLD